MYGIQNVTKNFEEKARAKKTTTQVELKIKNRKDVKISKLAKFPYEPPTGHLYVIPILAHLIPTEREILCNFSPIEASHVLVLWSDVV